MAMSLNEQNGNRRKAYPHAGYDYPILDGLAKDDKLKNKMRFDTMSICFLPITYSYIAGVCKLFSCTSKPIHALLASKRRLIDLQKMPFWSLTNALLKSN